MQQGAYNLHINPQSLHNLKQKLIHWWLNYQKAWLYQDVPVIIHSLGVWTLDQQEIGFKKGHT